MHPPNAAFYSCALKSTESSWTAEKVAIRKLGNFGAPVSDQRLGSTNFGNRAGHELNIVCLQTMREVPSSTIARIFV